MGQVANNKITHRINNQTMIKISKNKIITSAITALIAITSFSLGYKARQRDEKIENQKNNPETIFSDTAQKEEANCPDNSNAIVMVAFGQSNSANYEGERHESKSDAIVNFYNGKCYKAKDPMLGATGRFGSIWIPLATEISKRTEKK